MSKGLYRIRATDPLRQDLVFQLESGADVMVTDEVFEKKKQAPVPNPNSTPAPAAAPPPPAPMVSAPVSTAAPAAPPASSSLKTTTTAGWAEDARQRALAASTLEELKQAIAGFDGLEVKRGATNLVFAAGNPSARVMLVGEAPGEEEDQQGFPFVGKSGKLLDKILATAGLSRASEDARNALYISNVLNWRPAGNRTPTPQEMEIARPFIERHIALIQPDILLFAGAVAVQTLLPGAPTLSKVRERWIDYKPQTPGITLAKPVTCYALYHPAYLLRSPLQKKKAWHDMLALQKRLQNLQT